MPWAAFVPVVVLAGLFLPPQVARVSSWRSSAGLLAYAGWLLRRTSPRFAGACVVTLIVAAMMTWLAVSRAGWVFRGRWGSRCWSTCATAFAHNGELPTLPDAVARGGRPAVRPR